MKWFGKKQNGAQAAPQSGAKKSWKRWLAMKSLQATCLLALVAAIFAAGAYAPFYLQYRGVDCGPLKNWWATYGEIMYVTRVMPKDHSFCIARTPGGEEVGGPRLIIDKRMEGARPGDQVVRCLGRGFVPLRPAQQAAAQTSATKGAQPAGDFILPPPPGASEEELKRWANDVLGQSNARGERFADLQKRVVRSFRQAHPSSVQGVPDEVPISDAAPGSKMIRP